MSISAMKITEERRGVA